MCRQVVAADDRRSPSELLRQIRQYSKPYEYGTQRLAHYYALKANYASDMFVNSSIMDMYAKCGSIKQSHIFSDMLKTKDVVSWNLMITGYGIHGFGFDVIELFDRIQEERLQPDAFTYVGIFMAYVHAGLVEDGLKYFKEMREKYVVEPKLEHYACVVDMLGQAGHTNDVAQFIEEMPEKPNGRILSALLAACRNHSNISLGEEVAGKLIEIVPFRGVRQLWQG